MNGVLDRTVELLDAMEPSHQAALLAQAAHNLTVSARDETAADGQEGLRRYNEIQHLLSAQVTALLKGHAQRYPGCMLLDIVMEAAGGDALGLRLCKSVEWSLSLALEQQDSR